MSTCAMSPAQSARPASEKDSTQLRQRSNVPPSLNRGHLWWRILAGLIAAPLAWIVQICICEVLTSQMCTAAGRPLGMTRPQVLSTVAAVSAAAMLVGVLGMAAAWSTWRLARRAQDAAQSVGPEGGHRSTILRRTRFLGMVGILGSAIFLLGLILTVTAALMVSPCVQG